jgi:hypothetical protein
MAFHTPLHLTDPMVRDQDRLPHGEALAIDLLAAEVERRKSAWLTLHPGWTFRATDLVRCSDGSPLPAYDVSLEFWRPRTLRELGEQALERVAFETRRKQDYLIRENEQKALLQEVLASIKKKTV